LSLGRRIFITGGRRAYRTLFPGETFFICNLVSFGGWMLLRMFVGSA
jgi:hypothetical protein